MPKRTKATRLGMASALRKAFPKLSSAATRRVMHCWVTGELFGNAPAPKTEGEALLRLRRDINDEIAEGFATTEDDVIDMWNGSAAELDWETRAS